MKKIFTIILLISAASVLTGAAASSYTGLIIDAHGYGIRPDLKLEITNIRGEKIFKITDINYIYDYTWAREQGFSESSKEEAIESCKEIVGENPFIVKAVGYKGDGFEKEILISQIYRSKPNFKKIVIII